LDFLAQIDRSSRLWSDNQFFAALEITEPGRKAEGAAPA
jgi:hypothetical protein